MSCHQRADYADSEYLFAPMKDARLSLSARNSKGKADEGVFFLFLKKISVSIALGRKVN